MTDEHGDDESATENGQRSSIGAYADHAAHSADRFIHYIEIVAAWLFAVLFAIGVVDLIIQVVDAVQNRAITDPLVVLGFIDTGLLLLIIVEIYRTVIAYVHESQTREIVHLVIYTGIIALVRKVIIFQTSEYATMLDALFAALSYTVLIFGLVGLLMTERVYGS